MFLWVMGGNGWLLFRQQHRRKPPLQFQGWIEAACPDCGNPYLQTPGLIDVSIVRQRLRFTAGSVLNC